MQVKPLSFKGLRTKPKITHCNQIQKHQNMAGDTYSLIYYTYISVFSVPALSVVEGTSVAVKYSG
jgi:hypothetical protein